MLCSYSICDNMEFEFGYTFLIFNFLLLQIFFIILKMQFKNSYINCKNMKKKINFSFKIKIRNNFFFDFVNKILILQIFFTLNQCLLCRNCCAFYLVLLISQARFCTLPISSHLLLTDFRAYYENMEFNNKSINSFF